MPGDYSNWRVRQEKRLEAKRLEDMKIYETQNRKMKRNFAQSVDMANFDYLDPVED